ncbi:hypothetical protein B0H10DRAFT_253830 [Mycena sp. CBHHK59/15]|nr:hypothetical protein B0H10DRAFT_253830 [Mycena sp. CBHHK59/15]
MVYDDSSEDVGDEVRFSVELTRLDRSNDNTGHQTVEGVSEGVFSLLALPRTLLTRLSCPTGRGFTFRPFFHHPMRIAPLDRSYIARSRVPGRGWHACIPGALATPPRSAQTCRSTPSPRRLTPTALTPTRRTASPPGSDARTPEFARALLRPRESFAQRTRAYTSRVERITGKAPRARVGRYAGHVRRPVASVVEVERDLLRPPCSLSPSRFTRIT